MHVSLCWSSFHELFQVRLSADTQHKPSIPVGHNGEVLWGGSIHSTSEELLELLQGGIHRDDFVYIPFSAKLVHRLLHWIITPHNALLELLLQFRNIQVPQQRAIFFRYHCQVSIVSFESA